MSHHAPMKLVALVLVAACGSTPSPATTPPSTAVAELPDVPFAQLDQAQQKQFMGQRVMPAMKPIFQRHDPHKFAKFQCETCHGKGAASDHFDMPNPELPKLDFADMSKFKREDLEWMKTEVFPTMAKVLRLAPYSPDNPKGFGCLACHTST